jgi:hypothetical protein
MGGAIELSTFVQMPPELKLVAYVWSPGSNTTAATGTFCAVQAYISPLQANYTARLLWLDEKTPHFDWLGTFGPFITPNHPPARAPVANKSQPLPTTKLTPGVSLGVFSTPTFRLRKKNNTYKSTYLTPTTQLFSTYLAPNASWVGTYIAPTISSVNT